MNEHLKSSLREGKTELNKGKKLVEFRFHCHSGASFSSNLNTSRMLLLDQLIFIDPLC